MNVILEGEICPNCKFEGLCIDERGIVKCICCGFWFRDKEMAKKVFENRNALRSSQVVLW